ncbi:Ig-like domain-containing protein [Streptomyces sp. NPDC005865]|uniref:L,D-transpeptidase family protein n=1 Tax=Streptomyces sp. NPDC005865 TaxID=3155453 RepID=UPI0033C039BA
MPMPPRLSKRQALTLLSGAAALTLGGITAVQYGGHDDAAREPRPTLRLRAAGGGHVAYGKPIQAVAGHGVISGAHLKDKSGHDIPGHIEQRKGDWTSDRPLAPGQSYTLKVTLRTESGRDSTETRTITTQQAAHPNKVTLAPGSKGATVGIAQLITLTFDHPVADKKTVEQQLHITTSHPTKGAWGWVKDRMSGKDRVEWRPRGYWKPGTRVHVQADLAGQDAAADHPFARDYAVQFAVGAAHRITVDIDTRRLRFLDAGHVAKELHVSAGKDDREHATWTGTIPLMAKEGRVNMRSETVGLSNYYNKDVQYGMRLTASGTYAHDAPWNDVLGTVNNSSGCVQMTPNDARWLFEHVQVGDPFEISGHPTRGTVAEGNGFAEWNIPWRTWLTRSALTKTG